ncbi:glucose-1-phosphate cytidylyltransferase [Citrifermentans bemidjiense Bem]|uniref:Glucose-1-phosphate cytidylyltransferase n=1 Tax=Citrifermentans bemidjiense (strain ATCC BAA-1014 / DSM 16622 / JCM 12645 / Bem) TaxID=404380 RepID=B5EEY2_CITBB|nr:glucose-1-phosphate cytidylyltransferase [Citrifermentans bemidjiense]ACH37878.1 glucose-1-phosphate cytidylyltransferase [Citrifermentans bemidjiense Bem]
MKVVILAGGLGTRLSEETVLKPKPMVEIGGKPILWHIMKIYSHYGFNDFIICLGFKGYVIKEYFSNYFLHMSNVTFDFANNSMEVHEQYAEPWRVTLVDTGQESMTGGRVRRVAPYLDGETFMLTYGDGVADVNIAELVAFHKQHGKLATVTSTQPAGRFGALHLTADNSVASFHEKPVGDGAWINGGFFVLQRSMIDHIACDATVFEKEPLERLAAEGELVAYKHGGFWQPMDTLRDKMHLEDLWESGKAPWKLW